MTAHVLYVGGEDHHLRIPFMRLVREQGYRVSAAGSGDAEPFRRAGIDFHHFRFDRFTNPRADWTAVKALSGILRDIRPDLAQCYDTKPCLLLPWAGGKVGHPGIIRTITGLGWVYSSSSPLALAIRPALRLLHGMAARSTAATVFEIHSDKAYFDRHGITGRRGVVIPAGGGGVDVPGFRKALADARPAAELRRELGLASAEVVITVTRMTRQKGIPTLLKAAALVHKARQGVRFLLVGPRESEGPLAVSKAEIDQHSPYVMALGARSDVPALLLAADLFAFPTGHGEGVPRVLLEAALAGLPIVSSNMPGCCEVIQDGVNGCIVPAHDPEALAANILGLLIDRESARRMAAEAAETVARTFSLQMIVERHAALYSELLAAAPEVMPAAGSDAVAAA